jgi:FkbM family methyltransferase
MPQTGLKRPGSSAGWVPWVRSWVRRLAEHAPAARAQRRRMLAFYGQFVRPGDLCFDIGANIGNRTDVFLRLGARVVAVEPQPLSVAHLRQRFRKEPRVALVTLAVGARPGVTQMLLSDADMISSLSPEWIAKVKASGRFANQRWDRTLEVDVTTLDALIREHGRPAFCKIDVEGYEAEVVRGLTQALEMISFEFTPEALEPALSSIRRLAQLGPTVFNYSVGENMAWQAPAWLEADAMIRLLQALPDPTVFGDVYARSRP